MEQERLLARARELASAFSLVRANGGELKLIVCCATVRALLIRTHLLDLLPTFPTEGEALASFEHRLLA